MIVAYWIMAPRSLVIIGILEEYITSKLRV